jgi:hypothetical protein
VRRADAVPGRRLPPGLGDKREPDPHQAMHDTNPLPPMTRGNVWTGLPTFTWPAGELSGAQSRSLTRGAAPADAPLWLQRPGVRIPNPSANHRASVFPLGVHRRYGSRRVAHSQPSVRVSRPEVQPDRLTIQSPPLCSSKVDSPCRSRGSLRLNCARPTILPALVLRHAGLRILLHLTGMVRRPRNFRWHLRCVVREFYDPKRTN